ncbi:ADP-ribose glycohydrolase OARD1 [Mytilus coruscus]|uniref:ADP-ribose glycohydrolase OARD1 n=1 Tax=Mytilus coruscus TaxID=42192 RepID=A0A6J8DMR1_MYTCO|nr:ADP-ribose glycohydrolase OARD1 [Mytilus coruscus]
MAEGGGDVGFSFEEKKGDLFDCPETDALAHCVSEDLRMGKGIAVLFKKKFGGVGELMSQGKKTGKVAVLKKKNRLIIYLITKPKGPGKPSYASMGSCLKDLKKQCIENNIHDLSMPKIGKKTGGVAVLKKQKRFVYYLITKVKATGKPTYDTLRASLKELKVHCVKNEVHRLAMPKIGCGLDRLEWEEVSTMICEIFSDTNIHITVYTL